MTKIAIIGAGLAGLGLAQTLKDTVDVSIFEKSRGPGGRMATREAGDFNFDHGAQYFTVRSRAFRSFIRPFIDSGLIREWTPKIVNLEKNRKPYKRLWSEPHYVASPGMNSFCRVLAEKLKLLVNVEVLGLSGSAGNWCLDGKKQLADGPFDWVISTAPAPQSRQLLPSCFAYQSSLDKTVMSACSTLMLGFVEPPGLNFDVAVLNNPVLDWIAVNSRKPGRESKFSLLLNSTNA
jgi:renalase